MAKKERDPSKKPAKKRAPKKAPAANKEDNVEKILLKAPYEAHFILLDGRRIDSVRNLVAALEDMHEDIFSHHVNSERNDFANWIHDIFEDKTLSEELKKMKGKVDTELALLRRLVQKMEQKIEKKLK